VVEQRREVPIVRTVIVYESLYGNTHAVATAIADGMRGGAEVTVVQVAEASSELVAEADLLVVGGPTHAHGMTSSYSRADAIESAAKDEDLHLDDAAYGPGLRDWFDALPAGHHRRCAAFDTRYDGPVVLTGRASRGIERRLHRHGFGSVAAPESFLVDKENHLLDGELDRAMAWGSELAAVLAET
jgi:hypothetical protein